jgi:hypothetical protein
MSPLTVAQYIMISLRLERRVFMVATESMVASVRLASTSSRRSLELLGLVARI